MSKPDVVGTFLTVLQSGLVVSGNNYIGVERALTSGDARTSLIASGKTDLITLRLSRSESMTLRGAQYMEVKPSVTIELSVHYPYTNTSNAVTRLNNLVTDCKITVSSGSWNPIVDPRLMNESWPVAHEKAAKAQLVYRTRYLYE